MSLLDFAKSDPWISLVPRSIDVPTVVCVLRVELPLRRPEQRYVVQGREGRRRDPPREESDDGALRALYPLAERELVLGTAFVIALPRSKGGDGDTAPARRRRRRPRYVERGRGGAPCRERPGAR